MSTIIKTANTDVHVDDYDESPEGVYHISVRDKGGVEIGYWTKEEIVEDPVPVLGAIFGAIKSGTSVSGTNGRTASLFRLTVDVDVESDSRVDAITSLQQSLENNPAVTRFGLVRERDSK